jgi:hypothetical protein
VHSKISYLSGLSCPLPSTCDLLIQNFSNTSSDLGTSYEVLATTDSGSSWTQQRVPSAFAPMSWFYCATATSCIAVGGSRRGTAVLVHS